MMSGEMSHSSATVIGLSDRPALMGPISFMLHELDHPGLSIIWFGQLEQSGNGSSIIASGSIGMFAGSVGIGWGARR